MNILHFFKKNIIHTAGLLVVAAFLWGCSASTDRGAFDLESTTTGQVDKKGFPVLLGGQYERGIPLKRRIERAELESELQAIADARASSGVNFDRRRNELLQQRLRQIARTHGAQAEAEIEAACTTDDNGVVSCTTD